MRRGERPRCPYFQCVEGDDVPAVKRGRVWNKGLGRLVQVWQCRVCGRRFRGTRGGPHYRQKKPRLDARIAELVVLGLSERRIARMLGAGRDTVHRKILRAGARAATHNYEGLRKLARRPHSLRLGVGEHHTFIRRRPTAASITLLVDRDSSFLVSSHVAWRRAELGPNGHQVLDDGPASPGGHSRAFVLMDLREAMNDVRGARCRLRIADVATCLGPEPPYLGDPLPEAPRRPVPKPRIFIPGDELFHVHALDRTLTDWVARLRGGSCFSRRWDKLSAIADLFAAHFNWCKQRSASRDRRVRDLTPAMQLGIARRPLRMAEILARPVPWYRPWRGPGAPPMSRVPRHPPQDVLDDPWLGGEELWRVSFSTGPDPFGERRAPPGWVPRHRRL